MILSNYAIKFRTAVFVFIAVLVLAGSSAYMRLPREGMPDITIPHVFVRAVYDGTAPGEMEKLITIPLEKKLAEVENVKQIRSTSADSYCALDIEFVAGENIDLAKQRVKDKVDLAKPDLPEDLDEPIVDGMNFSSDIPVYIFAISGRAATPQRLKNLAETLQDLIEQIPGVKAAELAGIREREIRVEIDLPRLVAYDLPLEVVLGRIAEENRTLSAGHIETGGDKYQVRIPGEFTLATEMRGLLLAERPGGPVYLSDVAAIRDTFKDVETLSRLNGEPCVSVNIKKRIGVNAVRMIREVKKILDGFTWPAGIHYTAVMDQSDYVASMISELENNIFSGFVLVVITLLLFLGARNSIFVGLAIPFSMLIAFTVLSAWGQTLNMIALFSLVLAVGMLVDNAIVIVENIYRNRTLGLGRREAARRGAAEVAWPVITSTLTTVAAFSPLLFWPDIMGQFMSFLPRTLIVVLSASLFVAIIINPALCSRFIQARPRDKAADERPHPFTAGYERMLRAALRYRGPIALLGFLMLAVTVLLYARYGAGTELFPQIEPRNAQVNVKFPQGASIERTDAVLRAIEETLPQYEDVRFYLSTAGIGGGLIDFSAPAVGSHQGRIHVEFLKANERAGSTTNLVRLIRENVGAFAGAEIVVQQEREGPPTGAPIQLELSGEDFDTLAMLAGEIRRSIATVDGLVDLDDDLEEALPEIRFAVDRHRAAMLGLNTTTIGTFLRMAIYGIESSKFRADEDEYDITVRLPAAQRNTMDLLDRVFIPLPGGRSVPLTSLGTIAYEGGRGAIRRKDQKRMVTITGNNQGRGTPEILADIRAQLQDFELPRGYRLEFTGDNKEMAQAGRFLLRAFGIALGLILVILVIQFNSAALPLLIATSVLLSLIGVMWGLLICKMRFSVIMTGLGVISLAGIVVNNAIVLIDCILQRRADGLAMTDAIVAAGRMRLRPVLLTAVTTVLGLIPMAIGYSLEIHTWPPRITAGAESSAWWAPMAVAVIFGLAVATVLTLILLPVMFSLVDGLAARFRPGDED